MLSSAQDHSSIAILDCSCLGKGQLQGMCEPHATYMSGDPYTGQSVKSIGDVSEVTEVHVPPISRLPMLLPEQSWLECRRNSTKILVQPRPLVLAPYFVRLGKYVPSSTRLRYSYAPATQRCKQSVVSIRTGTMMRQSLRTTITQRTLNSHPFPASVFARKANYTRMEVTRVG
jgi:hypothetical protein